ncbi:hypothetical protein C9374_000740 [Naegleria lovaniensis]|uniref:Protein kinase domain-containing protein n=1 Tax=Naegleria lovaniensis TaxID=51637 RepID=A0AA88GS56_NAELO|nr:uncharacterized protein C9374_000740 [Naegleria lovaniensis]KAG2387890.1 hypothetical protein C9374_000740 [Naegleria lovaniensis]
MSRQHSSSSGKNKPSPTSLSHRHLDLSCDGSTEREPSNRFHRVPSNQHSKKRTSEDNDETEPEDWDQSKKKKSDIGQVVTLETDDVYIRHLEVYATKTGRKIDNIEYLSNGGQGRVFKVTWKTPPNWNPELYKKTVAVKVVSIATKSKEPQLKTFQHAHIAKCYRCEEIDGRRFLEMKLYKRHLGEKAIEETEIYRVLIQISQALMYLYNECGKVLHRDVKVQNILVKYSDEFKVVLADLGLARGELTITEGRCAIGTEDYKTPWHEDPSPKTDIYALGRTIVKVIEGTRYVMKDKILFSDQLQQFVTSGLCNRIKSNRPDYKTIQERAQSMLNEYLNKPHMLTYNYDDGYLNEYFENLKNKYSNKKDSQKPFSYSL